MIDIKKQFGEKVRFFRHKKSVSQEQFAVKSKLHRTYISDIERGVKNVSLENIQKIAIALDVNISDLFDYQNGG